MTLSEYLAGWHGTRATNRLLAVAVIAMATVAIVETAYLMERERIVVLVPPRLQEQATVGRSQADASYHTTWAHLLADMLGNVTPANAAFLKERLQPLLDPAIFGEVTAALERQLDEIRRERVTLAFEPKRIVFEPATGKTFVTGQSVITGLGSEQKRGVRTYELQLEISDYRVLVKNLATYDGEARTQDRQARVQESQP